MNKIIYIITMRSMWWIHLFEKVMHFFQLVQKSYESKQYKKGLKAADAILKKFPDHGGIVLL
jgi:uncharacterized protein YktA (UPF0223 family)